MDLLEKMSRNTKQKKAVLKFLNSDKIHPTAQEIFKKIKIEIPNVSRGTVYRNLESLKKEKKIRELCINGIKKFESIMDKKNHGHFVSKENIIVDLHPEINFRVMEFMEKNFPEIKIDSITLSVSNSFNELKKL